MLRVLIIIEKKVSFHTKTSCIDCGWKEPVFVGPVHPVFLAQLVHPPKAALLWRKLDPFPELVLYTQCKD